MNLRSACSLPLVLLLALFGAGCGNPPPSSDTDAGAGLDAHEGSSEDSGVVVVADAATSTDTGASPDVGTAEPDGGPVVPPTDAGTGADSGVPTPLEVTKATAETTGSVLVEFNRAIDPGSVLPNGSQFSFTAGLTASAASASGSQVRVTTSTQTSGASYVVTVATTVQDASGSALSATANVAGFIAPQGQARLVINEINPNIPNSRDLIEFLVVEAGTTKQMQIIEEGKTADPLTFTTFPDVLVQAGDLVVLHLNPVGADDPKASERTSKSESTAKEAYPNAWDFVGGSAAVTFSHRLLKLVAADGTVQDVVPFAKVGLAPPLPGGFEFAVQFAQDNGQWLPADCGTGVPCTYASVPSVLDVSVDWSQVGNTKDSSLARKPGADTDSAADWVLKATGASFGSPNP
ncbi:MAG TPA: Ig-like domain-containing protein [Myxococcales bacterium]|jgi:hypothetical protein